MKISKVDFVVLIQTIYVGVVSLGISYLIGFLTNLDLLLIAALPLGVFLVLLLAWLPSRSQLVAWGAITIWLLSTVYLGASDIEYIMLFAVVAASVAGVFWSPYFLVAIWIIHPVWDLIPRDLPDHLHDLPLACLIYDLVVALYLFWRTKRGFFEGAVVAPTESTKFINTGLTRTLVAFGLLAVLILQILIVGTVAHEESAIWFAPLVAAALVTGTSWAPLEAKKIFWLAFTIWTGMTFAHSGDALEIAVFGLMIVIAVLGYRVSIYFWASGWVAHALWNLLPREPLSHETAMLMGHWMMPLAGFMFEGLIAIYLVWLAIRTQGESKRSQSK